MKGVTRSCKTTLTCSLNQHLLSVSLDSHSRFINLKIANHCNQNYTLNQRYIISDQISYSFWFRGCSCGICAQVHLYNPRESLCWYRIEKCFKSLQSAAVLTKVEITPECITLSPAFGVIYLYSWSLQSAETKYKGIDWRKYCQPETDERWDTAIYIIITAHYSRNQ